MKAKTLVLALLLAVPALSFAKNSDEPSVISAYVGKYSGTVLVSGNGQALFGTANATIKASKNKERGVVSVTSFVSQMGLTAAIVDTLTINKRKISTLLAISTTSPIPGSGSVKVGKKQINYTSFIVVGSDTAVVIGKITLGKKRLTINETLSTNGFALSFAYSLKRSGGSKD
jgi:hypothetical protein